jgi:hypothetical protein
VYVTVAYRNRLINRCIILLRKHLLKDVLYALAYLAAEAAGDLSGRKALPFAAEYFLMEEGGIFGYAEEYYL